MKNKIPQEIEDEELSKPKLIWKGSVGEAIKQGRMTQEQLDDWNMEDEEGEEYLEGFKAGQKQTNEEELKFLKTLTFPRSNIYIFSSIKSRIQELKTKLTEKEKRQELFSDIWDNKEDDRWDKEEITGGDGE